MPERLPRTGPANCWSCPWSPWADFAAARNVDFSLELTLPVKTGTSLIRRKAWEGAFARIRDVPVFLHRFRVNYFLSGSTNGGLLSRLSHRAFRMSNGVRFPREPPASWPRQRTGVDLVVGIGKTTTLAMLMNLLNQEWAATASSQVEEPVEYYFLNSSAFRGHAEVGR